MPDLDKLHEKVKKLNSLLNNKQEQEGSVYWIKIVSETWKSISDMWDGPERGTNNLDHSILPFQVKHTEMDNSYSIRDINGHRVASWIKKKDAILIVKSCNKDFVFEVDTKSLSRPHKNKETCPVCKEFAKREVHALNCGACGIKEDDLIQYQNEEGNRVFLCKTCQETADLNGYW